ncbi:MAG: hypothetical protein KIS67_24800 [Verrucomicrobiae bacterium]|nr:hypothetical protein [Verrucomicrobiae bacterium]
MSILLHHGGPHGAKSKAEVMADILADIKPLRAPTPSLWNDFRHATH